MGATRIGLLGPLTVDNGEMSLGRRDRVVLTALATHPGEVVSTERLADALWGAQPPLSWNKVVLGCVMRLRRTLGARTIETTPHGYRLTIVADHVDSQRFERLVGRGRHLSALGEAERAAFVLGEALALWRGRPLQDAEDWEPARIEAARLEELRLVAEEVRVDACMKSGQHRDVLAEAQARVAEAPFRERRWAQLALAQYRTGRQGEALRTLHQARTLLATEFGVDPGPELVELEQAILRQDMALVADAALTEASAVCPYPGLVAYDVADAEGFFGRDVEVTDCLRRLAATGVLVVVGPSGSGKSSLVRAGVAAAMQRDGRRVVVVTPGARPAEALIAVAPNCDTVLVVDPCEQAVTLCDETAALHAFFAALVDRAAHCPLVMAVRADRLGDVSTYPAFARLVERGLFLLGPMDDTNLRAAVEGPAHQGGLLLEPGLVDLLVREVEGQPGALPLLSHALRQTWTRREGRTLTVEGYRETGGIRGAVAQTAEEVYERVSPEQRPILRDLLLRLVAPSADGEPIGGRVPRRSLATDGEHEQLIEQLVAARLLTSDDEVVELAHEALARAWPRLRGWLDDDVEGQRILRHLTSAADAWNAMGRPDSELYRGMRLAHTVDWRDRTRADLTPTERDFLATAQRHAEHEARHQRSSKRRRRALVVVVGLLAVVAVVAGVVAVRQRERAETAAVAADVRRAAALALETDSITHSLLLAAEAVRLDDTPDTRASLLAALSRSPALVGSARNEDALTAVDVSPDGAVVAAGDGIAGVSFQDANTLEGLAFLDEAPFRLEYRPDGEQLALATSTWPDRPTPTFDPVPVVLIDPATFEAEAVQLGGLLDGQVQAWDLDYSADGRFLAASQDVHDVAAGSFESTVLVWDVDAPEQPIQRVEVGQMWALALSPGGSQLYIGAHDPALKIYDVATGDLVRSTPAPEQYASATSDFADALEISPDGTTLAIGAGNAVVLLDAATLTERTRLRGHPAVVRTLQFSRDGTVLASGSDDGAVLVWDLATGSAREHFRGHAGTVSSLAFGHDDTTLYSASYDGQLLAWDLDGGRRSIPRVVDVEPEESIELRAVLSPDAGSVAYFEQAEAGGWERTLQFLDVPAGRLGKLIATDHTNIGPSWRPSDADQFATTSENGSVSVWNWRTGELITERQQVADGIGGITYTTDGRRILVGVGSGAVLQLDADTLEPVGPTVELDNPVDEVVASPDGRTAVALLGSGADYALLDTVDGTVLHEGEFGFPASHVDFSPDGQQLAVGGLDGQVGVLDLDTHDWVKPPVVSGHEDIVGRVAFAPDGATVASGGWDGRVSLLDVRTGQLLATITPGGPDLAAAVEFLPDGHSVIISTADGAVFAWDSRLDRLIESACRLAGGNLTEEEWREAFGDRPYRETCP